ncbi:MAG: hypothetical protein KDE19_01760 [Caldilineaceae bacterium]|nr:hypothetical protein [Caldilineaceae bacterium]
MEFILATIHDLWANVHSGTWPELGVWSYLLLILLVATEGPVSTLLGAAAAAAGILDLRYVFVGALLGNVLGDCLWYTVGSVSTLDRLYRYGRWLGLREHHLVKLEWGMHAHATKLIAISKLAIGLIIPTLVAAGLARVPWRRWFPLVLAIETVWTIVVVNVGFHSAGMMKEMERGIQFIGAGVLLVVLWIAYKYSSRLFQHDVTTTPPVETTGGFVGNLQANKRLSPASTTKRATVALEHTTKAIAAKSQALRTSAPAVAKPISPVPAHFAGD